MNRNPEDHKREIEQPKVVLNPKPANRTTDPMGEPNTVAAAIAVNPHLQQILEHGPGNTVPETANLMNDFRSVLETRDPASIRAWKDANWNKIPGDEQTQADFLKLEQDYNFAPQPQGPESSPWAAMAQADEIKREDLPSSYLQPSSRSNPRDPSRSQPTIQMVVPHNLKFKEQAPVAPNSNGKMTKIITGVTLAVAAATAAAIGIMKFSEKNQDVEIAMTTTANPVPDKAKVPAVTATATAAPAPTAAPSIAATAEATADPVPTAAPDVSVPVAANKPEPIPTQILTAQMSAAPVSTGIKKNTPPQKSKYDGIMREVPF